MAFEGLIISLAKIEKQADATTDALGKVAETATAAQAITNGLKLGITSIGAAAPSDTPPLPSDLQVMEAEESIYRIGDAEAALQPKIDAMTAKLDAENATAADIGKKVDSANETLTASQQKLNDMADAAGLTDKSGVGAAVQELNDRIAATQEHIQYLKDTATAGDDHGAGIAEQQKLLDDLNKQLVDSEKKLRIAKYEFENSDAYAKQKAEIANEQIALDKAKKEQEEEAERVKAAQAALDAQKVQFAALEAEKQRQQEIIDAKQKAADAAAQAAARKKLEEDLAKVTNGADAAAQQIDAAADRAVKAITDVLPTSEPTATTGSPSELHSITDILPDSGGVDVAGGSGASASTPANTSIFNTFSTLIKIQQAIERLPTQIDAVATKVDERHDKAQAAQDSQFEKLLKSIGDFGGYKLGEAGGTGVFGGTELLEQLEKLIIKNQQPYLSPQMLFAIQESIQKIVNLIHIVGGAAGRDFQLSQFERWVNSHRPPVSSGGAPPALRIDQLLDVGLT